MVDKLWTYERDPGGDSFTCFFNHFVNFAYIQIFTLTTKERKNKPEAILVNHEPEKQISTGSAEWIFIYTSSHSLHAVSVNQLFTLTNEKVKVYSEIVPK